MSGDLCRRAVLLADHIKSMHCVILMVGDLRESSAPTEAVEELEMSARNRLRDILEAVDKLPYTAPKVPLRLTLPPDEAAGIPPVVSGPLP